MVHLVAVLVSALLLWAAFPPLGFGVLAFVAPAPLFWAIRRVEQPGTAVALGFLWGATFYGLLLTWIIELGFVAWVPLTLFMGAITAGYITVIWVFRLWPPWRWLFIAVGGWLVMEWLRGHFPFGGFPWGDLGYPAADIPGGLGAVQWFGPFGWSLLAVALSAALAVFVEQRDQWRPVVDVGVVVVLVAIAGTFFGPAASGEVMQAAIVQGGTPCPQTRCQNENQRIYERHLAQTRTIPARSVDLVVWPENSLGPPYEPQGNDTVRAEIAEQASRIGAYFLVSGTRRGEQPGTFENVNTFFSPDGVIIGEYLKRHPVPFGEFVPLRGLLDFIPQLERVPNDMVRGSDAVVFPFGSGTLGSVISFEGAFARHVRSMAVAGSNVMVVATNESSYSADAPASDQLIEMVRVNAAAIGQDLVHAAITGKSTFVFADGTTSERTELLEERVLYGRVQLRTDPPTIYTRFGDWVMLLALAGLAVALAWPGEGRTESRRVA